MAYIRDSAVAQSGQGLNVTDHTGVLPVYETGDMLVWMVSKDTTGGGDLTTPTGWSQFDSDYLVGSAVRVAIFYKTSVTGGSETAPTTTSADSDSWISVCVSIDEYDTADPFGAFITFDNTSSSDEFTIPALTTDENQALVIWYFGCDNVAGPSIYGGGAVIDAADGVQIAHCCYYDTVPAIGSTGTRTARSADARLMGGFVFAINPSATADVENVVVTGGPIDGYIEDFRGTSAATGIGAPAIASLAGLTVAAGVTPQQTADGGTMPYQRAYQFSASISDTTIYGFEYTFGSALDLSSDTYLNIHLGMREPKEETFLGAEAEIGIVVALSSNSGTAWRAWHLYARRGDTRITNIFDSGFCLDANNTATLLDSSGTFDATNVTSIHILYHSVVSGAVRAFTSRLTTSVPWVLTNGSTRDPVRVASIFPYQEGAYQVVVKRLGASQFLVPALVQIGDGGTTDTYAKESGVSIEFPPLSASKSLTYHMADNAFGFIFKLTATDYLLWENGGTFSTHPYRLDAPDSLITADIANFNSWVFAGPGTTVFQYGFTFNDCTFNGRGVVESNGAYFDGCLFTNGADNSALTIGLNSHLTARLFNCEFTNNTYGIEIDVSNVNQIVQLNNVTFSGNTADIYIPATRTADLTIQVSGGDTPTVQNDGSGTVTILSTVTVTVTAVDESQAAVEGASVYLKTSGGTVVLNGLTDSSGQVTGTFDKSLVPAAIDATVSAVRSGSNATPYQDFALGGSITASGYDQTVILSED